MQVLLEAKPYMKRYVMLATLLLFVSSLGFGQDMKVKWEDKDGREFSVKILSGDFGYTMVANDIIYYYPTGKVSRVGYVFIDYYPNGKLKRVGNVPVTYNRYGNVSQVGSLFVRYNQAGQFSGTSGKVRFSNY